jgi:hypothetical protein
LETVIYTMDKIVTGERENPFLPNFLAGDRILLLVHGEAVAGIDFANLKSGAVSIQGKNIRSTSTALALAAGSKLAYTPADRLLPVDPDSRAAFGG